MIRRRGAPKNGPVEDLTEKPRGFDDYDLRLGDVMRGERATLGKSLLDVQRELKIKATYIAAIENSDPTAFETPGFVAGYVRSYARYLNLDPEWAYARFCAEGNFQVTHGLSAAASGVKLTRADGVARGVVSQDPFENPNTPFTPQAEGFWSRVEPGALGSMLVLVALIGAIGFGGWSVLQEVQKVQLAPVEQTPGVAAQVDPLAPADTILTTETAGLQPAAPDALDRLYRPQALEVPVLTARDGPIATLDPGAADTLLVVEPEKTETLLAEAPPLVDTAPVEQVVQVVEPQAPEVAMIAVRPAWVRIRAADGTVIFEKILDAGERYVLPATEEPPFLRAGNPSSLYFSVNGETYGPASTGPSAIKNVALGAEALREKFPVADLNANRALAKVVAELQALDAQ